MTALRRIIAAAVVSLSLLVNGCSAGSTPSQTPSTPANKMTIGLTYTPNIQFAPMYVAAEKGFFAEQGLDVTLRHHGAQETLLGALQAGTEDVVYAGGDEALQTRSQGVDVVNFATLYQEYPVVLIVPESSPIKSVADLKGRTVGLPGPYGENWFWLLAALKQAGLTEADVDIQSIGYTQQAALIGAEVDAVVGFSNNNSVQFRQASFPIREISSESGQLPLIGVGLGTMGATLESREADLTKLLRAVKKAMQYNIDHPQESVELSAKYVPSLESAEQQQNALATLNATNALYGSSDQFGAQNPQRWEAMATFLNENGLLKAPVEATAAYTTRITEAAR